MIRKNHNLIKLQASGLQFIVNQFTTILLFFITSKYLSKELFANFNWLTALYVTIGSLISYGIEQMIIKSVAEKKSTRITRIYFFHLALGAALLFSGITAFYFLNISKHFIYYLFGIWLLISLCSAAFKNTLTGLELFRKMSNISLVAGCVKLVGALFFILLPVKSVETVLLILTAGLLTESLLSYRLLVKETDWRLVKWSVSGDYVHLLKTAYPQLIVVVFGVALARFDWLYIGIASPGNVTADYTFAYKMFEFAKLPMLIISPLLLPLFTRIFSQNGNNVEQYRYNLRQLYDGELFLAGLLPVSFACFWTAILNVVFNNKYGDSNYIVFCILSFAIPLQYTTDYYWNLTFAQSKYKLNMWVSVITAVVNITLVVVLTPFLSAIGTAIAYTLSYLVPFLIYSATQSGSIFKIKAVNLLIIYLLMSVSLWMIYLAKHNPYITFFIPLAYVILLVKSRFIDLNKLKAIFLK